MYESEVYRQELSSLEAMIEEAGKSLNVDHLKEQLIEYQEDMASPGFWDDTERSQKLAGKARVLGRRGSRPEGQSENARLRKQNQPF